jgi:arginine decarboxylase
VVYATQSIHKLLAGISQASHVLVQDAQNRQAGPPPVQRGLPDAHQHQPAVQHHRQLRCGRRHDGAARRHRAGRGEHHAEALDFRRAMRKIDDEYGDDWWFKVWGPEKLVDEGMGRADDWIIKQRARKKGSNWHGFGKLADGFNMLDPIKSTIVTPGWT